MLTGFILAGGQSRRMGTDKAMLRWGEVTLLEHMIETVGAVADPVLVVGRGELPDRHPGRGPVEGIRTALAATDTGDNLVVAVDLPHLDAAFLRYFAERIARSETGLTVCRLDGRIPLSIGIHRRHLHAVDVYLESGRRSLRGLVETIPHDALTADDLDAAGFSEALFRNVNFPDEYLRSRPRR